MDIIKKITKFLSKIGRKEKYPVFASCSVCGERVYLPFFCDYCHRYYCDRHRLPFEHDCENIDEWKKQPVRSSNQRK